MKLALIIINYKGGEDTAKCLLSVYQGNRIPDEVIVLDNASNNGSLEMLQKSFPQVTFLAENENLGFAEGNNVAICYALKKEFTHICLLNNDTVIDTSTLKELENASARHPNKILGGSVLCMKNPTMLDHIGGMWNKKKNRVSLVGFHKDPKEFQKELVLDYIYGCCMFIPVTIFNKIGLFDSRFFLYWEEFDFCMRAKKHDFISLYIPTAKILHKGGGSSPNRKFAGYFFSRNQLLWIEKNIPNFYLLVAKKITSQIFKHVYYLVINFLSPSSNSKEKLHEIYGRSLGTMHYLKRRFGAPPKEILP